MIHDGKIHSSGLKLILRHHLYPYIKSYMNESNEYIFDESIRNKLNDTIYGNGDLTIMLYGQTGTGKTYTMRGIINNLNKLLIDSK